MVNLLTLHVTNCNSQRKREKQHFRRGNVTLSEYCGFNLGSVADDTMNYHVQTIQGRVLFCSSIMFYFRSLCWKKANGSVKNYSTRNLFDKNLEQV